MSRVIKDLPPDTRLLDAAVIVALCCFTAAAVIAVGFLVHWAQPHFPHRP